MEYNTESSWAPSQPEVKSVVVVTPSVASAYLKYAIESVKAQETDFDVTHLIVWDGPIHNPKNFEEHDNMAFLTLPWNVGRHGFYGHRVYAAIGHLVNHDAVLFLDEDNTYEPNHIQTCVKRLNKGDYSFVHSYRNVIDQKGKFLCKDKFEAVGMPPINLVDTSSYCFRRTFLVDAGHLWHHGWGADRRFFQTVKPHVKFATSGYYTLNYRLDGNPNSPTKEFFFNGNEKAGYNKDGSIK